MADTVFHVAIHYGITSNGYIAYNIDTKELTVVLPEQEWADKVKAYLTTEQTIQHAVGLNTYETVTVLPVSSLDNLKLALTRMWTAIEVQVDWSRPWNL
ncbi:hypothetical protein [Veillonella montpellierensis]|uniref:hypothetical protein n=1 Tax=Veillonella montpellierensis TaxID=187328 RepID=UPI0023FA2D70|nr:hypothetical protein [Veillonella montpellierensis]